MKLTEVERIRMGLRLRDIRLQRVISVRELSSRTGISEGHLSNIEHGGKNVSLDAIVALVRVLDVSLDYVVLGVRPTMSSWGLVLRSDDELESMILID